MERKIITFGNHFKSFINSVDDSVRRKIDYVLDMLKTLKRINSKFVKLIKDGVYELRVEWDGNIYRVFFIFDEGNIVVLFNGFQKKTRKTPQSQIKKAGFKQAMLSENSVGRATIVWQGIKHIFCPGEPKVEMIAMSRDTYDHQRLNRWLIKIFNIPVAMWTAVDLENAKKIFNNAPQVRMIYTNELSPQ